MLNLGPDQYKALFYLAVCFATFVTLLLVLRTFSERGVKRLGPSLRHLLWLSKESLEIVEIIKESPDVKSFVLRRKENKPIPEFKPGQFLTFQIGDDEKQVRSYSISSSALHRQSIQVSIKRIQNGLGSEWFHQRQIGDLVIGYPPSGHFIEAGLGDENVFIAGGIGITPMLSIIRTQFDRSSSKPMTLVYGARSRLDLAFHEMLLAFEKRHPHFKYVPILSHNWQDWDGAKGFISFDFLSKHVPNLKQAEIFICGPGPMMDTLVDAMTKASIKKVLVHTEKFVSPTRIDPENFSSQNLKINFEGKELSYKGKASLLEFFESENIDIPFACRSGVCGSCRCLVQGKVQSLSDSGLTSSEVAEGYVLTCVSYPLENLTVSR